MKQARTTIPSSRWRVSAAPSGSAVRAWVQRTCAEQGLAAQVTDPATVGVVATLVGVPLDPPHGIEAPLVEAVQSAHGAVDGDVSQDRGNDRALPRQRQGRPGGAQRSRSVNEVVKR